MRRYFYSYLCCTTFSRSVGDHDLLLRCQPLALPFQHVEEEHLVLPPNFWRQESTDCWGNRTVSAGCRDWHQALVYESVGVVAQEEYAIADPSPSPLFLLPTALTAVDESCFGNAAVTVSCLDKSATAEDICHIIYNRMTYRPGATTNKTTAQEALLAGEGVCQDFAHIMIGLCRRNGIPARYVVGLLEGEGATHAWVEVWEAGVWTSLDLTHDRKIDYGYIKIAHGRDAADCQVCRGLYKGAAEETSLVKVLVQEI